MAARSPREIRTEVETVHEALAAARADLAAAERRQGEATMAAAGGACQAHLGGGDPGTAERAHQVFAAATRDMERGRLVIRGLERRLEGLRPALHAAEAEEARRLVAEADAEIRGILTEVLCQQDELDALQGRFDAALPSALDRVAAVQERAAGAYNQCGRRVPHPRVLLTDLLAERSRARPSR